MIFRLTIHHVLAAIFLLGSPIFTTALHSHSDFSLTKAFPRKCSDANASLIRYQIRKEVLAQDNVSKESQIPLHAMSVSGMSGFLQISGTQFALKLVQMLASNNTAVLTCVGEASSELQEVGAKLQSLGATHNIMDTFSNLYEASKIIEPIAKLCLAKTFDMHALTVDFDHKLPLLPVFLSSLVVGSDALIKQLDSATCSCGSKDFENCGQKMGLLLSEHLLTQNGINKETFIKH